MTNSLDRSEKRDCFLEVCRNLGTKIEIEDEGEAFRRD